jgi:chromosome segregation ATPase
MASTTFVINVAPDTDHAEETVCSLEFGKNLMKVPPRKHSVSTCRSVESGDSTVTDNVGIESSLESDGAAENELEILLEQLQVAKTKLAQAEARGQGEQFDLTAPEGEIRVLKRNLRRVQKEEAKVREARFELAELRALCKDCGGGDDDDGNLKKVAAAKARLEAREKELRNYQDIVARQQSIRNLYRPAMDVYKTCQREVRHLQARVDMLQASR